MTLLSLQRLEIKKSLRNFSGWEFEEDSDQQKKKRAAVDKYTMADGLVSPPDLPPPPQVHCRSSQEVGIDARSAP